MLLFALQPLYVFAVWWGLVSKIVMMSDIRWVQRNLQWTQRVCSGVKQHHSAECAEETTVTDVSPVRLKATASRLHCSVNNHMLRSPSSFCRLICQSSVLIFEDQAFSRINHTMPQSVTNQWWSPARILIRVSCWASVFKKKFPVWPHPSHLLEQIWSAVVPPHRDSNGLVLASWCQIIQDTFRGLLEFRTL